MQLPRVAQLTQRTNQFNFTTVRRTDGEIQRLSESGLECRVVEVSDRFGDYGLVGVMIFAVRANALEIDTFLLSCRVLGRGVEHRMLNELGEIARRRQLSLVTATLIPTQKNLPARRLPRECGCRLPAGDRGQVGGTTSPRRRPRPSPIPRRQPRPDDETTIAEVTTAAGQSFGWSEGQIATVRANRHRAVLPEQVFEILQSRSGQPASAVRNGSPLRRAPNRNRGGAGRDLGRPVAGRASGDPRQLLRPGGNSLLAVDLFARIERRFGKTLPLTSLIEAPTIEQLARLWSRAQGRGLPGADPRRGGLAAAVPGPRR